jgi:hypothetical protein
LCYHPLLTAYQQNGWHTPQSDPAAAQLHNDLDRLANQLHILLPKSE